MNRFGDDNMGRFSVEVELANNNDVARAEAGDIPTSKVRRTTLRGVVDSGATRLVIPESVARQLGLQMAGEVGVRYADGRTAQRAIAGGIHLTWGGRSSVFNAIVEPERDSALIGAIVLEDLDLLVDCATQELRPRDPRWIISEVE
jgi:predicted aspartyl protease